MVTYHIGEISERIKYEYCFSFYVPLNVLVILESIFLVFSFLDCGMGDPSFDLQFTFYVLQFFRGSPPLVIYKNFHFHKNF